MKFTLIIFAFLFSTISFNSRAQDAEKIRLLTQESMVNASDGMKIQIAWILADPFWEYLINVNPETADTDMGKEFYEIVSEYNIISVVMGEQSGGGVVFSSESELRKSMVIKGQDGNSYKPLKSSEITEDLNLILDIFRPIFAQFLGDMGANFHFFVFQKKNQKGELIFDPVAEKDVTLQPAGVSLTWNLPMSSLIAEKQCPKDNELMNGTWNYCPIHGDKLEEVND